ncbi:procathepsin L-like isoform X2 [Paralichthys olivaceus]|uniref:procathepsin L-like isoform X2 n=1 Tax=Paralichthys olivaceus TaxID=8255 RepID=UPI0037529991
MKLLLVVVAALAVASFANASLQDHDFNAWKLKFGRSYNSSSEEDKRMQIWLRNWKLVTAHNAMADQGNSSYRLGMTSFADLEHEEFKQTVFGVCLGSFNASKPRVGSSFLKTRKFTDMPNTMDWRQEGYVTPVKNQGSCGSCWSFSSTGALEGQHYRKTGTLVSLSEQQLVDCSGNYGNYGCNGGWMDNAFRYIQDNGGINTEDSYPYEAEDGECRYNPASIATKCTGYVDIEQGNESDLKEAVATVGPVSVAIDASNPSFQLYESGVYDETDCSSTALDHAVLIVGYGTESGQDYWLVKNSWGTAWGDQGYIKMRRNRGNQCGIATAASFPLV